ncbi:MAG: flagellar biosynthetic protein FliQ [Sandaracinaceae bacterium]
MSIDALTELVAEALYLALYASAPAMGAALLVGIAVAVLGVATQVQEASLSYVPKLAFVAIALAASGAWMAQMIVRFTSELWTAIPTLVS